MALKMAILRQMSGQKNIMATLYFIELSLQVILVQTIELIFYRLLDKYLDLSDCDVPRTQRNLY